MTTFTELLPERKGSKRGAVRFTPAENDYEPVCGVLRVDTDRDSAEYLVTEFAPGWDGRAFNLSKLSGGTDGASDNYACFVARNGQDKQCECRGFLRWGHCKHLDGLVALIQNGVL